MVKNIFPFVVIVSLILLLASSVIAIPQIVSSVNTEFGVYEPYIADVAPDVPRYFIDPDLANIDNKSQFEFADAERIMLVRNGFVSRPSQFRQVYDVYNYCQKADIPIFVTTDSMLHVYHILFDYTLRILESRKFYDDLSRLNAVMLERSVAQLKKANNPQAITAAEKNVAYFAVASVLLDPAVSVPADVKDLVDAELQLIEAHEGGFPSPIFGYEEDYSQYVPRGHYTRNEKFEKYFKSMMWYGRMSFRLSPREGEEKAKEETLQAILIITAIKDAIIKGEFALKVWDRIYEPTVFFVGKTDDLNIYDYMELMARIYGSDYGLLSPDALADNAKLENFIAEARKLRSPMISSSFVMEGEDLGVVTKGFRFMGQRFIPDSYMFQKLVHDAVMDRFFPKGLDIMAIMGSQRAQDILVNVYNEDRYPNYLAQLDKLQREFAKIDDELWAQNLYWNWLYVLMPLLTQKGQGYPVFMQNPAWSDKELSTALGSWAELRHDTILYAKQSYTFETAMPAGPSLVKGYVEPNPELYARLASLTKFTREGLAGRGLLLPQFGSKFRQLEDLLVSLKEISEIELAYNPLRSDRPSKPLTMEQYGVIMNIGKTLEDITTFSPEISDEIESEEDEEMAIIADVHTDPNSGQVLEEGVGYPLNIFVVVPVDGELRIAQGAMFSYYEFTWPMSNRLTDGQWQDMLETSSPQLPIWMQTFMDLAQIQKAEQHSSFASQIAWQPTEMNVSIKPELIEIGVQMEVKAIIHGHLESNPVVSLKQADLTIQQEMKKSSDDFFTVEYTAFLDTNKFKPGMSQITVKGNIGEEEIISTHELILERASAVEGLDYKNTGKSQDSSLVNCVYNVYPNPFNPDVWIPYKLNRGADVSIEIYNALGQLVRKFDLGYKFPGRYLDVEKAAHWDGCNSYGEQVSSGIYFYRLQAGVFVATGKMIAVK